MARREEDFETLVTCLACGGDYQIFEEDKVGGYRTRMCKWCTRGGMSRVQRLAWTEWVQNRRTPPPDKA